jgi:hypothetical protein
VLLESSYFHFKTDIAVGSDQKLEIKFLDEDNKYVSAIMIFFESIIKYKLDRCMKRKKRLPLSQQVLKDENKLWTIEKRGHKLIFSCNDLKLIDDAVSGDECQDKKWEVWGKKVVRVRMDRSGQKADTTSTSYHIGINLFA